MKLVKLTLLKHIEAFSPTRVANMTRKIRDRGILERPICVEENHWLILDGQHRYQVAKALGLKYIPCQLFDYSDEDLLVWSLRDDCEVSKELVIERSLSGNIYPYKTAKHKFPRKKLKPMIPLDVLRQYSRTRRPDVIDFDFGQERKAA